MLSYPRRFVRAVRANEQRMTALFADLATRVAAEVTRRAGPDGTVRRAASLDVQQAAGALVTAFFLGTDRRGERAPLDVSPAGRVTPLAPYPAALWDAIQTVVRLPVEQHAAIMRPRLPADLLNQMQTARQNPFTTARALVREQAFRPNPLATYDAPHTWVDPNGYRLSDRIWNTATTTRSQLDRFLDDAIARGISATDIAQQVETFLVPGRSLQRTNTPYGRDASYDAMRLARTEISRAHAEAQRVAAALNPFVAQLRIALSHRHPRPDICDVAAAAGPWPKEDVPRQYALPLHPHCLCSYRYVLVEDADAQIAHMRDEVVNARAALVQMVGPVAVERFTQLLLETPLTVTPALAGVV